MRTSDPDVARLIEESRVLLRRIQAADEGDDGQGSAGAGRSPDAAEHDLTDIAGLLARAGDRLPGALTADLLVLRAAVLGNTGRPDEALDALTEVIDRFGADETLEVVQVVAFARLTQINLLINAERVEDASGAAKALRDVFLAQPEGTPRAGIGTMLLDVTFWLLARQRDQDALAICDALVRRLDGGSPTEQAVAAGARFFAAQASGRLGALEDSRASIETVCEMGEPALAALDRIAAQFGSAEANPTWHAQIVATSVTVLWRLGRSEEARALAHQAAERFAGLGLPELGEMLSELEREVSAR